MQTVTELHQLFQQQKQHYSPSQPPSLAVRLDRLARLETLTRTHCDEIIQTITEDFGSRGADWVFIADIFPVLQHIQQVKKQLKHWIKRKKTASGWLALSGQKTYIQYEPLGVVGVMVPFNAPFSLAFNPAIDAIAAGNLVMIKASEQTPKTAALMQRLVQQYFAENELRVVTGEVEIAQAFAALPWDALLFTGGTAVGKRVMAAAGQNLTPVILELGGKSPCIVLNDAHLTRTAEKIAQVRMLNAGQVCIAGDYVLLPEQHLEAFVQSALAADLEHYPDIQDNPEFTAIINDSQYQRLCDWIEEARASGCRIEQSLREGETLPNPNTRKIPLTLAINPDADLNISREEIFGPILSLYTYRDLSEAIERVNQLPKALAVYVFGQNQAQINRVIDETSSGGVTVNDLMMHAGSHSMGFGGVGDSGMGRYKGGRIGFEAFSNPKSVHVQGLMQKYTRRFFPPYKTPRIRKMLRSQVGM